MALNLAWILRLGKLDSHECLLCYDDQTELGTIPQLAEAVFGKVSLYRYPHPAGESRWPHPQNWSWQFVARYIGETRQEPWLWLEADAIPLVPGWLDQIQAEYTKGGKPFMGTVVETDSYDPYINGVAVYPPNVSDFSAEPFLCRSAPWDMVLSRKVMPDKVHRANHLIQHIRSERGFSFETYADAKRILAPGACIFHKCKDGTLITVLGDAKYLVKLPDEPLRERVINGARRAIRGLITGGASYYHSGNLGDLVYALYAIKSNGGGDLLIGTEQYKTSPCAMPINRSQFDMLLPLLRSQSYLKNITFWDHYPRGMFTYDLNRFRNHWNDWVLREREGLNTLCKTHFHALGITHRFDENEAWLTGIAPLPSKRFIIHRSPRYRNPKFPWKALVEDHGADMLFIGLEEEHKLFEREVGRRVSYWRVRDFLEMAQLVAGAERCFLNQSFPLSLALASCKSVTVEEWEHSPDCRFKRINYSTA